jgi:hypothetical protein
MGQAHDLETPSRWELYDRSYSGVDMSTEEVLAIL